MKNFFFKIYHFILNIIPIKIVYSDVFIVTKVNQEIITNVDVNFEKVFSFFKSKLKKIRSKLYHRICKNSLINEKLKN